MSSMVTEQPKMMTQTAPYPVILDDLVKRLRMERGWRAFLVEDMLRDEDHGRGESRGLTLVFSAHVEDTYHPGEHFTINHLVIVPAATYNQASWQRWLFDAYTDVRLHECMENFQIVNECNCPVADYGPASEHHEQCDSLKQPYRPYAPNHGPGENVYVVREMNTDERRRTQYTGGLDHNRARPEGWSE